MALATKHCWKLLFMWDALLNSHEFFLHYQILHPISITKFLFIYFFFFGSFDYFTLFMQYTLYSKKHSSRNFSIDSYVPNLYPLSP